MQPANRIQPPAPDLRLTVDLPPRWKELPGNLRVALGPARRKLAFEDRLGRLSWRAVSSSALLHAAVVGFTLVVMPAIHINFPVVLDPTPREEKIVYYPTPSLPQMEDPRPSAPAKAARPEMREAFHPVQTIHVRRGSIIRSSVVDMPPAALPRVTVATANILRLAAGEAPKLAPQPVELAQRVSKIHKQVQTETPAPAANLPSRPVRIPELPSAAKPRFSIPATVPIEVESAPATAELATTPLAPVPSPTTKETTPGGGSNNIQEVIVISTRPGSVLAAPAEGGPGTLAMSPKGNPHLDAAGGDGETETSGAPAAGNSKAGTTGAATNTGSPNVAPANGGAGNANAGIPGVTIRGGTITLDSFGPPRGAPNSSRTEAAARQRRPAAITVIASPRAGGGLDAYGVFKSAQVYTIYVETNMGPAVLQFAARGGGAGYNGSITAPDAINANLPERSSSLGAVIQCVIDSTGHPQEVRLMKGGQIAEKLVAAIREWRFHPALSAGSPVAIDALIGIGISVH